MITQNGSIKIETVQNAAMQRELSWRFLIAGIILTVLGAAGLAAYLGVDLSNIFTGKKDVSFYYALIPCAVLGLGVTLVIMCKRAEGAAARTNKVSRYEFYKDYFYITDEAHGEVVASDKIYRDRIVRGRESANYLVAYLAAGQTFPVLKSGLDQTQLNTIRKYFNLPYEGETAPLPEEAKNKEPEAPPLEEAADKLLKELQCGAEIEKQ